MSRLEWLQMKRACSSYGPQLTPYEQVELFRLEAEHSDGYGHLLVTRDSRPSATSKAVSEAAFAS
jgi:hypothetical protein